MKKFLIIGIVLLVTGVTWYALSPLFMSTVVDEPVPEPVQPLADTSSLSLGTKEPSLALETVSVSLVPTTAHPASGTVRVVGEGTSQYLRYENFKTINGPDLRVYLATDINATDFVDLGPLKATEGNVNYPIPAGTDISKYRYALTWCEDFSVLFNSAELPY